MANTPDVLIAEGPTTDQQKIVMLATGNRTLAQRNELLIAELTQLLPDLERFADQAHWHIGVHTEGVVRRRIARLRALLAGTPPDPIDQLKDPR